METEKLSACDYYRLSHEYSDCARRCVGKICSEKQLSQYRTLIFHAIQALHRVKEFQLSAEQDAVVTLELCDLLVEETHDLDVAETYLSSIKERLVGTDLLHEKMLVESALVKVARMRGSLVHSKDALRNVNATLDILGTTSSAWELYFSLLRIELIMEITPSDSRISKLFDQLIMQSSEVKGFQMFVLCSHVSYCLDQHVAAHGEYLNMLSQIDAAEVPPALSLWKHLIELLHLIYQDHNITSKLSEFKNFVAAHKKDLTSSTFCIKLSEEVVISLTTPAIRYKDFKNIILLFQSVSYLTNCYDKKANFSTKFLPKVSSAVKDLINFTESTSALGLNNQRSFYKQILTLCHYYTCLESLILSGNCDEIHDNSDYGILVEAMRLQLKRETSCALKKYEQLSSIKRAAEFQLIGLFACFVIKSAVMSRSMGTVPFDEYQKVSEIWDRITKLFKGHAFNENHIWRCTLTVVWIASHYQPFTNAELSRGDDTGHLDKLKWYYSTNSFAGPTRNSLGDEESTKQAPVLKKSLLLLSLLNYLAGAIIVNELDEKCRISNSCFHLGKQQQMPLMRYVAGLSHLLNCGLAMKSKDVAITRSGLNELVSTLLKSGFEQAQNP